MCGAEILSAHLGFLQVHEPYTSHAAQPRCFQLASGPSREPWQYPSDKRRDRLARKDLPIPEQRVPRIPEAVPSQASRAAEAHIFATTRHN